MKRTLLLFCLLFSFANNLDSTGASQEELDVPISTKCQKSFLTRDEYGNVIFQEITNAFSVQHTADCEGLSLFNANDELYLVTGYDAASSVVARLFVFNEDAINDPYASTFPWTEISSAFDTNPGLTTGDVEVVSAHKVGSDIYLVVGGASAGIYYKFNAGTEQFELQGTIHTGIVESGNVDWIDVEKEYGQVDTYLVLQNIVYLFATDGVVGISSFGGPGYRSFVSRWYQSPVTDKVYLFMARSDDNSPPVAGDNLRLYTFSSDFLSISLVSGAFPDGQQSFTVGRDARWFEVGGKTYLAMSGVPLLWEFDHVNEELILTPDNGDFDSNDGFGIDTIVIADSAFLATSSAAFLKFELDGYGNPQFNVAGSFETGFTGEKVDFFIKNGFLYVLAGSNGSSNVNKFYCTPFGCNFPTVALVKTVDDAAPSEGDRVYYFITVNNQFSEPRDGVRVQDLLPSGVTFVSSSATQGTFDLYGGGIWDVGRIAANGSATLAIEVQVDAGTAGQVITNMATIIDAYGLDCVYGDSCEASADLTVQSVCSQPNVCVNDLLPVGFTFCDAYSSIGNYDPYTGDWLIGDLLINKKASLTITARVDFGFSGQLLENCATIKDPYNLDVYSFNNQACASVFIRGINSLVLDKIASQSSAQPGQAITFLVTVCNDGSNVVNNVMVSDVLPSEVTFVSSVATQGSYTEGSGVWNVGTLGVGSCETLFITVTINSNVAPGTIITNIATVGDPYVTDPYMISEDVTVVAPQLCDLSISKISDKQTVAEGEDVTFTVSVINNPIN